MNCLSFPILSEELVQSDLSLKHPLWLRFHCLCTCHVIEQPPADHLCFQIGLRCMDLDCGTKPNPMEKPTSIGRQDCKLYDFHINPNKFMSFILF